MVHEDEDPVAIMIREQKQAERARAVACRIFQDYARSETQKACRVAVQNYRAQQARKRRTATMALAWLAVALAAAAMLIDKFL